MPFQLWYMLNPSRQEDNAVLPRGDNVPVCENDIVESPNSTASATQSVATGEAEIDLQQARSSDVTDTGPQQATAARLRRRSKPFLRASVSRSRWGTASFTRTEI